jgi:hypothetical protein
MRSLVVLAAVVCGAAAMARAADRFVVPSETPEQSAERYRRVAERRKGIIIIVHRGSAEFAHENTLEAYRASFELGADGNEIDIRMTRDGVLVCFHDDMLDLILQAYGDVADYTLEELRGFAFHRPGRFGDQTRVPELSEVLELHRRHAGMIHLDIKRPGLDRAVADLIGRLDMWDHVVYGADDLAAAVLKDPRVRRLRYKANLFEDHWDVQPEAIARELKRDGEMVIVNDPRGTAVVLGRRLGKVSSKPVRSIGAGRSGGAVKRGPDPGAVLKDAADWDRVSQTPQQQAERASRIVARAKAADALAKVGDLPPQALPLLEDRVRNRSLHPDWMHHGADGAAALRTLLAKRAPGAVALAREAIWRDDPALDRVQEKSFGTPRSWVDWRVKMIAFPALENCPGEETEAVCRDYLAMERDQSRNIGPPWFEQAAHTLLVVSPTRETAVELMKHRLSIVRGRAILDCLARINEPWAKQALEEAAPHALGYAVSVE